MSSPYRHHGAADSSNKLYPWPDSVKKPVGKARDEAAAAKTKLFAPIKIRELELKNRIVVSPMCTYSSNDGFLSKWHLVHYGQFAIGGAGLIIVEATGVAPEGRITPFCAGIWKDEHIASHKDVVDFAHENSAKIGIQLAHAGRKASTVPPYWNMGLPGQAIPAEEGGWTVVAPSSIPFADDFPKPVELSILEIKRIQNDFRLAASRALEAGYDVIEIHGAHGYLNTSFCSPLTNQRTDEYGGSFENRVRFLLETTDAIRTVWPASKPLFVRLSCTDWHEDGWKSEDTVKLAGLLKERGVDLMDCSTGGTVPGVKYPVGPGYQVPFSTAVKKAHQTSILTGSVGLITTPDQAEQILQNGDADLVFLGRQFLRDPYWTMKAGNALGVHLDFQPQYSWAVGRTSGIP